MQSVKRQGTVLLNYTTAISQEHHLWPSVIIILPCIVDQDLCCGNFVRKCKRVLSNSNTKCEICIYKLIFFASSQK